MSTTILHFAWFFKLYDTKYATSAKIPSILKDFHVGSNPTVSAIWETRVNTGKIEKASIYAGLSVSYMFSEIAYLQKILQK